MFPRNEQRQTEQRKPFLYVSHVPEQMYHVSQKSPEINQPRLINPEWNEVEISLQFTPEGQSKYINLDTYIYIYI